MSQIFDNWPDPYELWFQTPIGGLVKSVELEWVMGLLKPQAGEHILDAGCGSGIFTQPIAEQGTVITGIDISEPMLERASVRLPTHRFLAADMAALPFPDATFDKTVSVTALEFIEQGEEAMAELFRVTRSGGWVVVATLNSRSPWASRRTERAKKDRESVFNHAHFRDPEQLVALAPVVGRVYTAVHFSKHDGLNEACDIEQKGQAKQIDTGAFLIGCWQKP